jgi:hypothetical protein
MTAPGREQAWTSAQLSARLAALRGVVPAATQFVVYRATCSPGASGPSDYDGGYLVPGEVRHLTAPAFDFWLARRGLAGAERLSVAVLVIRERLAADGNIGDCELEYRRGAADGPFCGSPARIVFTGPARLARFYQATPDGALAEIAPMPGTAASLGAETATTAAMHDAVGASCGEGARILDTREPTVIEAMIGISSVLHLIQADGTEVSCGVIWHGPTAVALRADFPRFGIEPTLSAHQSGVLGQLAAAEGLVACKLRRDAHGLAVVARRRASADLVLLRLDGETATQAPYVPGRPTGLTRDQERWLHYIETYEALEVLDAYHDGASDALIVLTGGADGAAWRHHVDIDGIETWRRPDTGSAAAALYDGRRRGDTAPAGPPAPAHPAAAPGVAPSAFASEVAGRFPASAYDIDGVGGRQSSRGRQASGLIHRGRGPRKTLQ